MIRRMGKTQLRVVVSLLVTAVVPLLVAMGLAGTIIQRVSQTAFQPEFGAQLERSLLVYKDLVRSMKRSMRYEGAAIAAGQRLREAATAADRGALRRAIEAVVREHPRLLSLEVSMAGGAPLGSWRRIGPLDPRRERPFAVPLSLGEDDDAPALRLVFAADRRRLDELAAAQEFARAYQQLARDHQASYVHKPYLEMFALLLGATVLLAVITGILVVRPVTRGIRKLAAATKPVAQGDLTVRVEARGGDEIAELARAFNAMLQTLDESRARIEFLRRVGEWQSMARRLAHEIKNPLTPIQLAVEECHRRYEGSDGRFGELLQTTYDIVVEEVATLRRLVGEFAEFARLPQADLLPGDVWAFLREQKPRLEHDEALQGPSAPTLKFDIAAGEMPVAFDRTMLYRALANLVTNAFQAAAERSEDTRSGRVLVRARRGAGGCELEVHDSGRGIPAKLRPRLFDPYVTTKREGTGLGLTIVKKIIIDHGGQIEVGRSELGGACFRILLPELGSMASEEALAQAEAAALSG